MGVHILAECAWCRYWVISAWCQVMVGDINGKTSIQLAHNSWRLNFVLWDKSCEEHVECGYVICSDVEYKGIQSSQCNWLVQIFRSPVDLAENVSEFLMSAVLWFSPDPLSKRWQITLCDYTLNVPNCFLRLGSFIVVLDEAPSLGHTCFKNSECFCIVSVLLVLIKNLHLFLWLDSP